PGDSNHDHSESRRADRAIARCGRPILTDFLQMATRRAGQYIRGDESGNTVRDVSRGEQAMTRDMGDDESRAATDRTDEMPIAAAPSATGIFRAVNALAWRRGEWLAAAASLLLVVSVAVVAALLRERERLRDELRTQGTSVVAGSASVDSLRSAIASRDSLIAGLTGRDVAVMTLTSSGARAPFARMFWDRATKHWTFVAHDMPALPSGRTYQLWLVTASAKISAGTFEPTNGDAVVRSTYALPANSLKSIAVTEEPTGGVPQPTGRMVIAGGR
ncbi:MAG TPA: anti-sigma factor, partial [Gemmatimonadaceae bacterium]|nr:anti-sigma factor [Gemmatimonadaceae bacterium]